MKPKLEPKPQMDNKSQIENELKRTRRELENTKNALKHQVARCRHLVSAFSKKLAEKDAELKVCKETREKQLSAVIRALLVLEARLRREQKGIRSMLAERDEIIRSQNEEISRLELAKDAEWKPKESFREMTLYEQNEPGGVDYNTENDGAIGSPVSERLCPTPSTSSALEDDHFRSILIERESLIKTQQEEIERLQSLAAIKEHEESTNLRSLLAERDSVIKSQQEEIALLQSMTSVEQHNTDQNVTKLEEGVEDIPSVECYAKPDLISSLCIDGHDEKESTESSTEAACQPDSLSSDAASTKACLGDGDTDSLCNCTITPPVVRGGLSVHDRSAFSPVPRSTHKYDNDPMPSTSIFHNVSPEVSKSEFSFNYERPLAADAHDSALYSPNLRTCSSSKESKAHFQSFDINYQDNPVLQCVNQILLKDPDDIMEDQRSNKLPSIESPFVDDADQPFWLSNNIEEPKNEEIPPLEEENPKPALATSSPLEKFNVSESETVITKTNRLSLTKLIELHNAARRLFPARRERDGRKSVSMNDLTSAILMSRPHPPVPPKPRKSGTKKVEFEMDRITQIRSKGEQVFRNPKTILPPQPVYIDRNKLDIISKPSPLPFSNSTPVPDTAVQGDDNELYVISNSAIDDEILQKLKGKNLKSFEIKLHRLAGEAMQQQQSRKQYSTPEKSPSNQKPPLNKAMLSNMNLLEAAALLRQLKEASQRRTADGKQAVSPSMSQRARLRVAASVAQLLAQAQQQAREHQLRLAQELNIQQKHSAAEQAKHNAECLPLPNEISPNLVENLPGPSGESPRPANPIPGAESTSSSPQNEDQSPTPLSSSPSTDGSSPTRQEDGTSADDDKSSGTYDNFLEATGLSQKSIMTPSRMLNNHRSVVKPKDVKLRNKVRNAAIFERTIPPQVVGPTVKYWTEPFL